jgi:acyl-CoA thioester hydrolase
MTDAAYAYVFSNAVNLFMDKIGIDEAFRKTEKYTIYTLETHLVYLNEALGNEAFSVRMQLLDHSDKLIHLFFTMENEEGERLATSEQMLLGVDMTEGRGKPFPKEIHQRIEKQAEVDFKKEKPKEAGRFIGIKKK